MTSGIDNHKDLRDKFVDRFAQGLCDGDTMEELYATPDITGRFNKAWDLDSPWDGSQHATVDDSRADEVAALMMGDNVKSPVIIKEKSGMPDYTGDSNIVISTGGSMSTSALSTAFASLERWNVMVSAIVISSWRMSDIRSWGRDYSPWIEFSVDEVEERGVFGRIWTAEVYVRNNSYASSNEYDTVWLLACPTRSYPSGLCSKLQICVGS
jgi:hypothetical protein